MSDIQIPPQEPPQQGPNDLNPPADIEEFVNSVEAALVKALTEWVETIQQRSLFAEFWQWCKQHKWRIIGFTAATAGIIIVLKVGGRVVRYHWPNRDTAVATRRQPFTASLADASRNIAAIFHDVAGVRLSQKQSRDAARQLRDNMSYSDLPPPNLLPDAESVFGRHDDRRGKRDG